jgi:hypothetical protein
MRQPDDPGVRPEDDDARDLVGVVTFVVMMVGALFCLVIALFASSARAHEWYQADCCSGIDCAPVDAAAVVESPAGFVVTIRPGTHPMWPASKTENLVAVYPYRSSKVRPSRDENWHVCISSAGTPLCLYVIGGGF